MHPLRDAAAIAFKSTFVRKSRHRKLEQWPVIFFWLENENYQLLLNWMSHIFLQQMKINNVFWIEWVIFFPTAKLTGFRNLWCFYLTEKNVDLHKKNNLAKWHHYIKQDWKTYIFALILIGSFLFLTCFMFVPNDLSTKSKYIKLNTKIQHYFVV